MTFNPQNPLVVQSDKTVLLEVQNDLYEEARDALARFAELEKSPEYLHTYRITPLSLWNAAAAGLQAAEIVQALERYSKYDLPANVRIDIVEQVSRYGRVRLVRHDDDLLLDSDDRALHRRDRAAQDHCAADQSAARRSIIDCRPGAPRAPQAGAGQPRLPGGRRGRLH